MMEFRVNGQLLDGRERGEPLARTIEYCVPQELVGVSGATIEYEVANLSSRRQRSLFSVLHRPARGFSFAFTYSDVAVGDPQMLCYFPQSGDKYRIRRDSSEPSGWIAFLTRALVYPSEGLFVKWEKGGH